MKIYQLSPLGKSLARSTNNPDTSAWKIVRFLDHMVHSTPDQIANGIGVSSAQVNFKLRQLERSKVVRRVE